MSSSIIVVGAGISGMLTAALLRQRHPHQPITIIEQSAQVGGLYTSIDYGEAGYFDYGMHVLYDTGIEEIDSFIHNLLPENEWHVLEGNRKEISGIFWNGKLQCHSPYIDLRTLPDDELRPCIDGLHAVVSRNQKSHADAGAYFEERFGKPIAKYSSRVIEKLYDVPAQQVSFLATRMPAMNRVLLFDKEDMPEIMQSELLRARIGYPDQLTLPPVRTTSQCGWYPRKFGMIRVINALKQRLLEDGIEIIFNVRLEWIDRQNDHITGIRIKTMHGEISMDDITALYWTAGLPALGTMLGIPPQLHRQSRASSIHLHLRFNRPVEMGELYDFYCFDNGFHTFRVTNYINYCPAAANSMGYPLCVEYWPKADEPSHTYLASALAELQQFRIIDASHVLTFSAVQQVPNYHRLFMLQTIQALNALREKIYAMNIRNLINIGVLAGSGELLLYEVMRDAYAKLL